MKKLLEAKRLVKRLEDLTYLVDYGYVLKRVESSSGRIYVNYTKKIVLVSKNRHAILLS